MSVCKSLHFSRAPSPSALHLGSRGWIYVSLTPSCPCCCPYGSFAAELSSGLRNVEICARTAKKTLAIYRTIAMSRLIPTFGDKPLNAIRTCDIEDFMAATLAECSPAYVNKCARTMKALLNHAVNRHIIPSSPLTEKITFEDVALPELELSDEERIAFLAAFNDERGFRVDVANRRREAHIVESEHFSNRGASGSVRIRRAKRRASGLKSSAH